MKKLNQGRNQNQNRSNQPRRGGSQRNREDFRFTPSVSYGDSHSDGIEDDYFAKNFSSWVRSDEAGHNSPSNQNRRINTQRGATNQSRTSAHQSGRNQSRANTNARPSGNNNRRSADAKAEPVNRNRMNDRNDSAAGQSRNRNTAQRRPQQHRNNARRPEAPKIKKQPGGPATLSAKIKGYINFGGPLDAVFAAIVLTLLLVGVSMMFSASYSYAYSTESDPYYFIKRQAVFAVAGVIAMFIASRFNYQKLNSKFAVGLYVVSAILLILALVQNLGKDAKFRRWIKIGDVLSFQPSEIAKFALIVVMAWVYANQYNVITKKGPLEGRAARFDEIFTSKFTGFYKDASTRSLLLTVVYAAFIAGLCGCIIAENHLSCTILMFILGVSMMWLAGVKKGYFIALAVLMAVVIAIVIKHPSILPGYAEARIVAWLDKDYDPLGARWQTNNSLYAIASGGPFGLGIGQSRQKHMYVSEPQNDFIFAIVCEELGFIAAGLIIVLFGALVWRAFRIARKTDDRFGAMVAMGVGLQVGLQVFLNIAVVTDMFPNTGISLPFFSYGGTSLLMLLGEMGIVLSISRQPKEKTDSRINQK